MDGKLSPAVPIWYDKSTVGWAVVDPTVFTIDLGTIQPLRGVGLHMGAGQAGVEWPTSIQVLVSDDGARYNDAGNLMQMLVKQPPASGYATIWLVADKLQTHGRFVKFVCSPLNLGTGAYIHARRGRGLPGGTGLGQPPTYVWPEAPQQWQANWKEIQWRDNAGSVPYSERPAHLVLVDGTAETGGDAPLQQAVLGDGGMSFTLHGEAGRPRSMSWTGKLGRAVSTSKCRYALLTFRAEGIRRTYGPLPAGRAAGGQRPGRRQRRDAARGQCRHERRPDPHPSSSPCPRASPSNNSGSRCPPRMTPPASLSSAFSYSIPCPRCSPRRSSSGRRGPARGSSRWTCAASATTPSPPGMRRR